MRVAPILGSAALAAVLAAGPAFAAADEPMSTAGAASAPPVVSETTAAPPATPAQPMTTAEQIDAFIRSGPPVEVQGDEAVDGVVRRDDRQVHGTVSVGVGTGGYRSVYVQSDMPVGQNGRLSLAFEDTKGPRGYGYGYYGGPVELRGAAPLGMVDRQRCDLEGMSPPRSLDVIGGPNGRCVSRVR